MHLRDAGEVKLKNGYLTVRLGRDVSGGKFEGFCDYWKHVQSVVPNYKECREWLKVNGDGLRI